MVQFLFKIANVPHTVIEMFQIVWLENSTFSIINWKTGNYHKTIGEPTYLSVVFQKLVL